MALITNGPHTVYNTPEAEKLVNNLNASDDWFYKTKVDPNNNGKALVRVYDEDGCFMGYL